MEKYKGNVIKCTRKNSYMYFHHSYGWFVELKGLSILQTTHNCD